MIRILFFASLRESLGIAEESVPLPAPPDIATLIGALRARGESWNSALGAGKRWRVAVNQEMATVDTLLRAGDEVAIFPPVTGG